MKKKKKKQGLGEKVSIAATASALGYLVFNMILRNFSENIGAMVFMVVMLGLSIVTMHFILDLHKYMFIKTYEKKGRSI